MSTIAAVLLAALIIAGLVLVPGESPLAGALYALGMLPLIVFLGMPAAFAVMPTVTPAAALVGGALWHFGAANSWARRRSVWASVGALFAAAVYAAMRLGVLSDAAGVVREPSQVPFVAGFILAGAGAALAFRAAQTFFALFFMPDEVERD